MYKVEMDEFIKIFKALTDKNRVRILKMLEQKELCVCEISNILGITVSTVSSHLSVLVQSGFVSLRKDGKWVYAKLRKSSDNPVLHQLIAMIPGWLNNDVTVMQDFELVKNSVREILCKS